MGTRIHVGNLPFSVTDEDLRSLFSSYGEIEEAVLIKNKFSGRSKGFGFVTFKAEDSAQKAITAMNGKDVQGRQLNVNEAKPFDPDKPRPPRRDFGGNRGGGFGGRRNFHSGGGGFNRERRFDRHDRNDDE